MPEDRPYPIVHPRPSFWNVVQSMTSADIVKCAALAVVSFPLGYAIGPSVARTRMMWAAGITGTLTGGMLAFQDSTFRLTGRKENKHTVAVYGTWPMNRTLWE